jgi:hypothetical protein
MFVTDELDMFSLCSNSIYFSLCAKFDMLPAATRVDCTAFKLLFLALPSATHIERVKRHIERVAYIKRRSGGAYRQRRRASLTRRIRYLLGL